MPSHNLSAGRPRKASQRRAKSASQPLLPPAFAKGDRVRWNHHEGEVVSVTWDAAEVLSAGKRWRNATSMTDVYLACQQSDSPDERADAFRALVWSLDQLGGLVADSSIERGTRLRALETVCRQAQQQLMALRQQLVAAGVGEATADTIARSLQRCVDARAAGDPQITLWRWLRGWNITPQA